MNTVLELDPAMSSPLPGGGRVIFTTRAAGNLSTAAGEGAGDGLARRRKLARELGLRALCASRQVHGTHIHIAAAGEGERAAPLDMDADGHASTLPGVGVAVLAADCVPVALGCEGAVAMIHAGWRGLSAGVLEEGVRVMRALGAGPIGAVVGPCAGACCYEVGPEVMSALGRAPERGHLDLRAVAHARLAAAGVDGIADVTACTICDERFFSYRREHAAAGRQGGVAWLS